MPSHAVETTDCLIMPVDFMPDFDPSGGSDESPKTSRGKQDGMGEALRVALFSAFRWMVPFALLMLGALYAMRSTLTASSELLRNGDDWIQALIPSTLYMMLGLGFGALTAWRIGEAAGISGMTAWLVVMAAAVDIVIVGGLGAIFIFPDAIPLTCWLSLGVFLAAAGFATSYFTFWSQ